MTRKAVRRYAPSSKRHGIAPQNATVSRGISDSRVRAFSPSALDGGVVASISLLAGIGLVMIYSITAPLSTGSPLPAYFTRHLGALAVSGLCLAVALHVPLQFWRRIAIPLWGACVALLLLTLFVGIDVNGARRWLPLPGVRFQAAEFAKFATLLAVAVVLTRGSSRGTRLKPVAAAVLLCAAPITLLVIQPDFGSSVVLCAAVGMLLFVGGAPLRKLAIPAVCALGGAASYIAARPYAHDRWTGFIDPWATASREGFQLVQSFVAFGRGGSLGMGLGGGRQKLFYLPEAHTDFILSSIAEELGLVGVLIVLGAFSAFVVAGARIARRAAGDGVSGAADPFAALVAFGMIALIALPAAINAAVVMGMLPTTGFTLPFVSFGGNSLLVSTLAVGILLRIGACEAAPKSVKISGASRRRILRT